MEQASQIVFGKSSDFLPTVFVSAYGERAWALSESEIDKLAYDLGAVAHVVIEPNRAFSFRLRDRTTAKNVYGGSIGIYAPSREWHNIFYVGGKISNSEALTTAVKQSAIRLRSHLPSVGWDWVELQEQALRKRREIDKGKLSLEETQELYETEIENLKEQNEDLKEKLAAALDSGFSASHSADELISSGWLSKLGPEIYPGELQDKLVKSAQKVIERGEMDGIDSRSIALLKKLVGEIGLSPGIQSFQRELDKAIKAKKKLGNEVTRLLTAHGFEENRDKTHIKLSPNSEYIGLENITISKTPSDHRSSQNLKSEIMNKLGLRF